MAGGQDTLWHEHRWDLKCNSDDTHWGDRRMPCFCIHAAHDVGHSCWGKGELVSCASQ